MRDAINDLTNDKTVLKIMETLKVQHKTEKQLLEYLGLANGTFTKWKYKNVKSYKKHIDRIAKFLNVTPEYLTQDVEDVISMQTLTAHEFRLLQLYRTMGEKQRDALLTAAEYYNMAYRYQECYN